MRIAIVDDEKIFRDKEKQLLEDYDNTYKIETYSSTKELLASTRTFDFLLLDIEMPDEDGLTFAKEYRSLFPRIMFVTSYEDKVFDAFGMNVLGFIKKGELDTVLVQKVDELLSLYEDTMQLDTVQGERSFIVKEILYFYYEYAAVYIKTFHKTYELKYRSLASLEKYLDSSKFVIANRNILMNVSNILRFIPEKNEVELKNGELCKVSKRNRTPLMKEFAREGLK